MKIAAVVGEHDACPRRGHPHPGQMPAGGQAPSRPPPSAAAASPSSLLLPGPEHQQVGHSGPAVSILEVIEPLAVDPEGIRLARL